VLTLMEFVSGIFSLEKFMDSKTNSINMIKYRLITQMDWKSRDESIRSNYLSLEHVYCITVLCDCI
jgi:hypothetical protein